jgi:ATP-dependent Clp protease ATP-binding subunit ClpB
LTKDNIGGIIKLLIAELNDRIADRNLSILLSKEAEEFIVDAGYDPVYGARPLKRYLQKNVETLVAKKILSDELEDGQTITIDVQNDELVAK